MKTSQKDRRQKLLVIFVISFSYYYELIRKMHDRMNSTWVVVCDISLSLTQAACTWLRRKRSDCDPTRLSRVCVCECVPRPWRCRYDLIERVYKKRDRHVLGQSPTILTLYLACMNKHILARP